MGVCAEGHAILGIRSCRGGSSSSGVSPAHRWQRQSSKRSIFSTLSTSAPCDTYRMSLWEAESGPCTTRVPQTLTRTREHKQRPPGSRDVFQGLLSSLKHPGEVVRWSPAAAWDGWRCCAPWPATGLHGALCSELPSSSLELGDHALGHFLALGIHAGDLLYEAGKDGADAVLQVALPWEVPANEAIAHEGSGCVLGGDAAQVALEELGQLNGRLRGQDALAHVTGKLGVAAGEQLAGGHGAQGGGCSGAEGRCGG